jgi:tyrosinase
MDTIFSDTNFFTFSSQLEGSPHGTAHVLIGGDMGGGGSARDPLFWTHHCMVDYCWAKWNIELGNDNTNDPAWTGTSWDHFVDGTGNPASVTAGLTTVMPLLSYRYESSAVGSSPAVGELSAADFKKIEKRIKEGAAVRFDIKKRVRVAERARISIARPFSQESRLTASDLTALIEADSARERIFASVNYARMPPVNDFFVRVFINMPDANAGTPTDDPHFAGSFAFFGTHVERAGAGHCQTDFLVDVMGTLRKLRGIGQLRPGQPISVQLVAVPATERFIKPEAELQLEGIDLIVTPVVIRTR